MLTYWTSSFLVVVFSVISNVQSTIVTAPRNQAVVAGQTATFSCRTDKIDNPNPITWTVNGFTKVRSGCTSSDSNYRGVPGDRNCDVEVTTSTANRLNVAGSYDCNDGATKVRRAILIVMALKPLCAPTSQPIRGREFAVSCSATLTPGSSTLVNRPLTTWIQCQGHPKSTTTTIDSGDSQLTALTFSVTTVTEDQLPGFNCKIHFSFVDVTHDSVIVATNEVTYSFTTGPLAVEVCPERMTIRPSSGPYTGGDVLTCYAYTKLSPPTFRWTDATGTEVGRGRTFTLPEAGGTFSYTCIASATGLAVCSNSTTISGTAAPLPGYTGTTVTVITESVGVTSESVVNTTGTAATEQTQSPTPTRPTTRARDGNTNEKISDEMIVIIALSAALGVALIIIIVLIVVVAVQCRKASATDSKQHNKYLYAQNGSGNGALSAVSSGPGDDY